MKRMTVMKGLFIVIVAGIPASEGAAAVISVQPVVAGFLDPATFAQLPSVPPGTNPGHAVVVQVDVMMEVLSLASGEDGFGIAAFSFDSNSNGLGDLVPDIDAGGWYANNICVDSGPGPGGLFCLFALNSDIGADSQDLEGILVQMAVGAFTNRADPRRTVGEAGSSLGVPFLLGSAFLEWNGLGGVTFTLNPLQVAAKLTTGQFVIGEAAPSATIALGRDVPEPCSVVLLGSGLLAMVFRRR